MGGLVMTKKQHYVPQFYMKYWLCDESKKIYYLDLKHKRTGHSYPKSICFKDYQYEIGKIRNEYMCPNIFENEYGKLETKVSDVLQRLFPIMDNNSSAALIFSSEEKELLRKFVLNMFLRNPNLDITSFWNDIYITYLEPYQGVIDEVFQGCADDDMVRKIAQNIAIMPDMYECDDDMLGGLLYRTQYEWIKSLRIAVLRSEDSFVFSDVPVHIEEHSVYIPLSPKYALLFGRKHIVQHSNRIYDILYTDAMKLNRAYLNRIINCPCNYLYAQDNERGRRILEEMKWAIP